MAGFNKKKLQSLVSFIFSEVEQFVDRYEKNKAVDAPAPAPADTSDAPTSSDTSDTDIKSTDGVGPDLDVSDAVSSSSAGQDDGKAVDDSEQDKPDAQPIAADPNATPKASTAVEGTDVPFTPKADAPVLSPLQPAQATESIPSLDQPAAASSDVKTEDSAPLK